MKTDIDWAEELGKKYDILPGTVLEIHNNFVGKLRSNGKYIPKRERTESFLNLYFEGRNDNGKTE